MRMNCRIDSHNVATVEEGPSWFVAARPSAVIRLGAQPWDVEPKAIEPVALSPETRPASGIESAARVTRSINNLPLGEVLGGARPDVPELLHWPAGWGGPRVAVQVRR